MRGSRKLSLLFIFFTIISISYPRPAAAVCDGCVVAAVTKAHLAEMVAMAAQSTAEIAAMYASTNMAIMGTPTGTLPGPFLRMVPSETPGGDLLPIPGIVPPWSLVTYYENVWWPRMIELTKAQQGAQDKVSTLQQQMSDRTAQAAEYSRYMQETRRMAVEHQARNLGRAEVLCPEPSMGRSALANREKVRYGARQLELRATREAGGDKDMPTAMGGIEYQKAMIQARINEGMCNPNDSNGAAAKYCKNPKPAIMNADQRVSTLMGTYLLDDAQNSESLGTVNRAQRFVENVFNSRAFEPIPVSLTGQSTLSPNVVQAMAEQSAYSAKLNVLQRPFIEEQANRAPLSGNVEALGELRGVLDRAGYAGEAKEAYIKNDKISRAAEDYIRYVVYDSDPKTSSVDLAGAASMSLENLMSVGIQKEMKQIVLMYDIREQIRQTNLLLGTIGGILLEPKYEKIRANLQAVQSGNDRPH